MWWGGGGELEEGREGGEGDVDIIWMERKKGADCYLLEKMRIVSSDDTSRGGGRGER